MRKEKIENLFSSKKTLIFIGLLAIIAVAMFIVFKQDAGINGTPQDGGAGKSANSVNEAKVIHWNGGSGDGKWSTALNWDAQQVPDENDEVIFDSGSAQDVSIDTGFAGKISSLSIKGFTGKITQNGNLKIAGNYYQETGAYTAMGDLEIGGDLVQKDKSEMFVYVGDTRISGQLKVADGFKINSVEGAAVYIKNKDDWRMITLNEDGIKGYDAVKLADSDVETWRFYNATNGLMCYISQEKGWTLSTSDGRWDFKYSFRGIERGGKEVSKVQNSGVTTESGKVSMDRGAGIVEWYENRFEGIEQGFTIKEKPAGEGELVLKGEVKLKDLTLKESTEEKLVFRWDEYDVLEYGGLFAVDANGKKIGAKLKFDKTGEGAYDLNILVDDKDAKYPIVIDPISTTPAWTGRIDVAGAGYGKVATPAGDVNGDGRSDFLVTAEFYGASDPGKAYLYYGSDSGISTTPSWSYEETATYAWFGHSATAAGDVNNDGYDDVVIGASGYDTQKGRLYLFLGGLNGLSTTPAWTYVGPQLNMDLGEYVASAGDVNKDGYDDIIAGAHYYDKVPGTITNSGKAFLFYGTSTGLSASPVWSYEGSICNELLGFKVAGVGDVNKDGYSDVLIGSPQYGASVEGAALLFHGSATGLSSTPTKIFTIGSAYSYFGNPVASGGDINKDGYPDILIGASRYDGVQANKGAVFAYYGSATGFPSTPSWQMIGEELSNAYFGSAWYRAGDVDGDGYDDAVVGSCGYNSFEGRAFVYRGSSSGLISTPIWSKTGGLTNSYMGWYANTAGDVNGDGADDFLVSAYKYDDAVTGGRAWLFSGSSGTTASTEVCSGGIDEDLDGLIDLADPDCDTSIDKANVTINVSTTGQNDWYDDTCNMDHNSDGWKDYDKFNMDPACGTLEPGDNELYYYQVCDSVLSSYDSDSAKKSYINSPFIGDEGYVPCSRDGVHDDYHSTDAISPLLVQPMDKDFTIDVSASDTFGISSIKIEWTNATTYSVTETDWHNSASGSFTCSGSANCSICIKGGDCGVGHDVIDYASLGIPDGLKQQKFYFRVTVVDNAPTPNSITTGYDDNTAVLPVLDKYYRLVICSKECHTCTNQVPTVSLNRTEVPTDFCQGLTYGLFWNFSDPDGNLQAYYDLQIREVGTTTPVLSAVRASSDTYVRLFPGFLSGGDLQYNKTYEWRVRAYDDSTEEGCEGVSLWTSWSPVPIAFTTPNHQYPTPSFTMTNSATPPKDCTSGTCDLFEDITFTSTSSVYVAGTPTYKWYIDDLATVYSTTNPTVKNFQDAADLDHTVKLTVTDGAGAPYSCSVTMPLNLAKKNPVWNEVAPKQD